MQFTRSFEVEITEPFGLVIGQSLFDTTEEQNCYLVKVLGGFTRLRAGFATPASLDDGTELNAFYWVKIGVFDANQAQIIPIPLWAGTWTYALQFSPTKYPCEVPHVKVYCP